MKNSAEDSVSVIIPTYNRKELIELAIKSVLRQTHRNYELIVVDDCSSDETAAWIKHNYPEIKLVELKKNRGAAGARNAGFEVSKGNYIAFLDSDDYWEPEYLATQVQSLSQDTNCSFVFCDHIEILRDSTTKKHFRYKNSDKYRDLIHRSLEDIFIYTMSVVVIRRSAFKQAGPLNEKLIICHDRELYIRLLSVGSMTHVPQPLVTRVMHNSNISADYKLWAKYVFMTLDIFFDSTLGKSYKDLEADIRSTWALIIARSIWQLDKDPFTYIWMIHKAFLANPKLILKKAIARLTD